MLEKKKGHTVSCSTSLVFQRIRKEFIKNSPVLLVFVLVWTYVVSIANGVYTEKINNMIMESDSSAEADSSLLNSKISEKPDSSIFLKETEFIFTTKNEEKIVFPMGKISFADSVFLYDPGALGKGTGDEPDLSFQRPELSLGDPDYNVEKDSGYVCLGKAGTLVLKFIDNVLIDGPGPDIHIFEINPNAEDILVWISQDGEIFLPVGKISKENPSIDIHPYTRSGATYRYIKLRDDPEQGEQDGPAVGADIDAVGAINTAIKMEISSDQLFVGETVRFSINAPSILAQTAQKIRQVLPAKVSIDAHTDSRGTEDFNIILSQQRAGAIRNYFLDEEALTEVEYAILGWGESKPIHSNDTEEGRRKNRRVEVLIQLKYEKVYSE